jgi:signal transduction histidine kinase/CheY-like chemotaxis protein/HPt (histidine-containing phosphotransfer) domain-containing protein
MQQRVRRERVARLEAETLLEQKSRDLYAAVKEGEALSAQLQQAVGFQTRKLLNAQRVAKFGTFVWDVGEELVTWSDGVYSILAIDSSNEQLSVERYFESVHPDDRESLKEHIENGIKSGLAHGDEFQTTHRILRPDGDVRWIRGLGEFTGNDQDAVDFMFGAIQDVTALKRADDEVQQTRMKLEERLSDLEQTRKNVETARDEAHAANMTKSRFIAMISHEIRTPTNGLLGTLGLLGESNLEPSQKELLRVAASSAEMLRVLLNDIIDFARLETGQIQLERADFSIHDLADQLVEFWRPLAEVSGNELSAVFDKRMPEFVHGDPARIGQIINNLLSNAIKFTKDGSIALRVGPIGTKQSELSSGHLKIEIVDSGKGIAKEEQSKLFKEFSQVGSEEASSNRFYDSSGGNSGAGLGLAICKALVEQMGGTISVISALGAGSRFCVKLPLGAAAHQVAHSETVVLDPLKTADGRKPVALIAEDVPANQMVARLLLESFGCSVEIVDDGVEAVAACKRRGFDFVLMDISMPRLDGINATKMIHAVTDDDALEPPPIIGLTAFAFTAEISRFQDAGMCDVISKPIHKETLYKAIQAVLQGNELKIKETATSSSDTAVDIKTLKSLTGGLSTQQIVNIVTQVSVDLDKLRRDAVMFASNGDSFELGRSCHAVKGLASSFGAQALAELAQTIEASARSGDAEVAFATTLKSLDPTTDAAIAVYKNYLVSYSSTLNEN